MSDLTQEVYESLPDAVKADYTEVDGVFKHAGMLKLKGSLNDLDNKFKSEVGSLTERLNGFEESKKAEIEQARKDALEQAKSKGEVDEIERLHVEQMADLEKRVEARTREQVGQEYSQKAAQKDADAFAAKLAASLGVDDEAREDLQALIGMRVKPDETGKVIFYNRDGSASAMTEAEFVDDVKTRHKHLVKGEVTTLGAGLVNGSKGGGGAKPGGKTYLQMSTAEKAAYLKTNPPKRV